MVSPTCADMFEGEKKNLLGPPTTTKWSRGPNDVVVDGIDAVVDDGAC